MFFWKLPGFGKRLRGHLHPTFLHPQCPGLQATKSQQQDSSRFSFISLCLLGIPVGTRYAFQGKRIAEPG